MKAALKVLVWTIALALGCVTAAANFRYGWLIATGEERYVYAVGGAVLDVVKTLLPTVLGTFLAGQSGAGLVSRTVCGWLIWALLVVWSITCALGLYAITKDARAGDVQGKQQEYRQLTDDQTRKQARLTELGGVRVAEIIEGEIAALKRDVIWTRTKECTDATVQESREHCAKIDRLTAELATAPRSDDVSREVSKLRADLREIEQRLAGMDMSDVFKTADPATEALANMTGLKPETVRSLLALMIALGLECGGLLPWLTLGSHVPGGGHAPAPVEAPRARKRAEPVLSLVEVEPEPEKDEGPKRGAVEIPEEDGLVARWAKGALVRRKGSFTPAADVRADFEGWCAIQNEKPPNPTAFGREMTRLGFDRRKVGGVIRYVDIALVPKVRELRVVDGGSRLGPMAKALG